VSLVVPTLDLIVQIVALVVEEANVAAVCAGLAEVEGVGVATQADEQGKVSPRLAHVGSGRRRVDANAHGVLPIAADAQVARSSQALLRSVAGEPAADPSAGVVILGAYVGGCVAFSRRIGHSIGRRQCGVAVRAVALAAGDGRGSKRRDGKQASQTCRSDLLPAH